MAEWISRLAMAGGRRIEQGYGTGSWLVMNPATEFLALAEMSSCVVPGRAEKKSLRHSDRGHQGLQPFLNDTTLMERPSASIRISGDENHNRRVKRATAKFWSRWRRSCEFRIRGSVGIGISLGSIATAPSRAEKP